MADIQNDETAEKPIGTSALLGLLVGIISHEIVYQNANSYLWFSLAGAIPGLYLLRALIKSRLKAMHVIESDDLTIARRLQGKISYSESFANYCAFAFITSFLIITIVANVLVKNFQKPQFQYLPSWAYGIFSRSDNAFYSNLAKPDMDIALVASDSNIDLNDSFIVVPRGFFLITGYLCLAKA